MTATDPSTAPDGMDDFVKYRRGGAYHWRQADGSWRNDAFNPALLARYVALARLVPESARVVLDVGCGDGYLVHLIAARGPRSVVGIDPSLLGVSLGAGQMRARHRQGGWGFVAGSGSALPIGTATADVAVMADVIEHLEHPELTLAELGRVLKPNGILLLSTPNHQPDHTFDPLHVKEYRPHELAALLGEHFGQVEVQACWPMTWLRRWSRGGNWRSIVNAAARAGWNPLLLSTSQPSQDYGQLVAVCRR